MAYSDTMLETSTQCIVSHKTHDGKERRGRGMVPHLQIFPPVSSPISRICYPETIDCDPFHSVQRNWLIIQLSKETRTCLSNACKSTKY